MDYKAKHRAYTELHSTKHIDKDIELLRKLNPKAKSLNLIDRFKEKAPGRLEKELLWDLLDVCSPEEILKNRGTELKVVHGGNNNTEVDLKKAQDKLLLIENFGSLNFKDEILPLFNDLKLSAENEEVSTIMPLLVAEQNRLKAALPPAITTGENTPGPNTPTTTSTEDVNPTHEEIVLNTARKRLLNTENLLNLNYHKELKPIVSDLGLTPKDQSKASLILALEVEKKKLQDELNSNTNASNPENTDNKQLEEENEELKSENEELQDENEELKDTVEKLEDTIEEQAADKKKE